MFTKLNLGSRKARLQGNSHIIESLISIGSKDYWIVVQAKYHRFNAVVRAVQRAMTEGNKLPSVLPEWIIEVGESGGKWEEMEGKV